MNIELHVMSNGVDQGVIPSYAAVDISPVFCDYGSISFDYPKNGKKFASLLAGKDEVEIVPYIDGVAYPKFGGLVQEVDGDDIAEAAMFRFTGSGYLTLLDEARVYPLNWPTIDPLETRYKFIDATAGTIARTLIQAAQARGSLVGVTTAFTNTTDTNGVAWNKTLSVQYTPGVKLTDVLKNLHDQGMCEFVMNGRELRMHIEGGLSTDRTIVTPPAKPLTFRKGRDLRDSPRKTSTRDLATVMLAAGKEDAGIYHEEVDATAVALRRRIEGFVSNGNVTDAGTLNAFSEYSLAQLSQAKMEKTHGLEFAHPKSPRPVLNFDVGDWCYSETGNGMEKLRIKQWVLSIDNSGHVGGSVTLNDLFAEINERLNKRIEGIVGGTTITGESRAVDVVPTEAVDLMPPKTPTGLSLSSAAYTDEKTGQTYAQVSASWLQVTQNQDNTAIEDLAEYQIRWRNTAASPGYEYVTVSSEQTVASWSPVQTNVQVAAHIRAIDRNGNASPWSTGVVTVQTGFDATPPEVPSAPTTDNYLGLVRAIWDGKTASGAAWAADFNYVEVHASTTANFTAVDEGLPGSTHVDSLSTAGRTFGRSSYGVPLYFRLRSVDHSGNKSAFTAAVSGTASQVVSADVFDGAIGSAKLADLAVTSAKINLLAVNSAQVGSLDVGKLVAGTLSAQVIVGNRLTTALTNQRTELNQLGLQAWNASNVMTIDLNGVTNLLTGTLQTALSGRRIVMSSSGDVGKILFYAPDGTIGELGVFTGDNINLEAVRLGIRQTANSQFWNQIQISEDHSVLLTTGFAKILFGGGTGSQAFDVSYTPDKGTAVAPFMTNQFKRLQIQQTSFVLYDGSIPAQTRMVVNGAGYTEMKHPKTNGGFRVWEYDSATVERARLQINGNGISYWDTNSLNRLDIGASDTTFRQGSGSTTGTLQIYQGAQPGSYLISERFKFITPQINGTGGVFNAMFQYAVGVDGSNYGFECRNGDDNGWIPIKALSFVENSDINSKKDVVDADFPALDLMMGARVRGYRDKVQHVRRKIKIAIDENGNEIPEDGGVDNTFSAPKGESKIGLVAQEAVADGLPFVTASADGSLGIDIYQYVATLHLAVQQLAAIVTETKGQKK